MSKKFRFFLVLASMAIGAWFLWPTVNWYWLVDTETKDIVSGTREHIRSVSEDKAAEVVGALLTQVKADASKVFPVDQYPYLVDHARKFYRTNKLEVPNEWTYATVLSTFAADVDPVTRADLPTSTELVKTVVSQFRTRYMALKDEKARIIQLGLDLQGGISAVLQADTSRLREYNNNQEPSQEVKAEALENAVEILKGRVDGFGISEPSIRADLDNLRVTVDIPGDNDRERINAFLVGGGNLKLQLVDQDATNALNAELERYRQANNGISWRKGDPLPDGLVPAGMEVREILEKDEFGIDFVSGFAVTKETAESVIDGSTIVSATPSNDNLGRPVATFSLNAEGASKFQVMTRDNVGKPMAIVLDGKLKGNPININEEIGGGNVQISGFDFDEATAISKVLRTGSLPIDLSIDSVQQVGASLGEDAIRSGLYAGAVGIGLVVLFMLLYYLGSGFVADVGLLLNVFLIMAILSSLNLTLTLTSIAGLILTVGMAVDANVLIFERIKEEIRQGKTRAAAVRAGYDKAFWSIMDGNITTIIASILLASFGTGPIRGFAVTLTVGIVTTLFTTLFVSRLLQDINTEQLGFTKISIMWRRK